MDVQYQIQALRLAEKCDIFHWFPCGADVQSGDYQNFLGG